MIQLKRGSEEEEYVQDEPFPMSADGKEGYMGAQDCGGRARPGVAQTLSSNSLWRDAEFFLTSTVIKTLKKLLLLACVAIILPLIPQDNPA
ncbi:Hypothetical predicted protein [Marmota monax]|uniref:Uncharacterized protein n=1 Tax=Marmota monax TaxID=9995 RepID=A0A5E4BF56_MARMO|nr:Hypothetical predicted protein [Marmota monax]